MSQRTDYLRSLINGEEARFNRALADIKNGGKLAFSAAGKRLDARDELGEDPAAENLPAFHAAVSAAMSAVGLTISKDLSTVASELAALPEVGGE